MKEKKTYFVYPGKCAICGRKYGDHLTELARINNPSACPFKAKEGDLTKPVLVRE